VNDIEKVAEEIKAVRTENREPGAEVRAILDRREHDRPIVDDWRKGSTTRRSGSTTRTTIRGTV
jgi:hypothetical protein